MWKKRGSKLDSLGALLVQVAGHESQVCQQRWAKKLDDVSEVSLFAEIGIMLLAITDRIIYNIHGDPRRSEILNPAVDTFAICFSNQRHFGDTAEDRARYFF